MKNLSTFLLTVLVFLASCELYNKGDYKEYYVVESYLQAGDRLPLVRLSKTAPIDAEYSFEEYAVSGADVVIHSLNADSSIAETYEYIQQSDGVYSPSLDVNVQDEQLYQLSVETENNDSIKATTYVPGNFETVNEVQDRYVYQSEEQIEIITTPSSYITNRQTYYIFNVNVLNPDSTNLTPFYQNLVEEEDNEIENYTINSSGIINEKNYERNQNGNIELRVPWLAIAFFETNYVIVNALDNNMYDFLRSQNVQTGGSTLSPGEIQNVHYNITGAIGIFGSMTSDTNRVYVERP